MDFAPILRFKQFFTLKSFSEQWSQMFFGVLGDVLGWFFLVLEMALSSIWFSKMI